MFADRYTDPPTNTGMLIAISTPNWGKIIMFTFVARFANLSGDANYKMLPNCSASNK